LRLGGGFLDLLEPLFQHHQCVLLGFVALFQRYQFLFECFDLRVGCRL